MDLQSTTAAFRLRIAAQIDAGQISDTEAQARMPERIAEMQNEDAGTTKKPICATLLSERWTLPARAHTSA